MLVLLSVLVISDSHSAMPLYYACCIVVRLAISDSHSAMPLYYAFIVVRFGYHYIMLVVLWSVLVISDSHSAIPLSYACCIVVRFGYQ